MKLAILALAAILLIPISGNTAMAQNDTASTNQTELPADNVTVIEEPFPPVAGNVTTPGDNVTAPPPVSNNTGPLPPLPTPDSPAMVECTQAYPGNPEICEGVFGAEPDCVIINAQGGVYNIQVSPPDPFRLDNDADGLGCEISQLQGEQPSTPATNGTS